MFIQPRGCELTINLGVGWIANFVIERFAKLQKLQTQYFEITRRIFLTHQKVAVKTLEGGGFTDNFVAGATRTEASRFAQPFL